MKRMIVFFIVFVFLIGIKFVSEERFPYYKFEKLVVISQTSNMFDCDKIKNGNQYYYTFDNKIGKEILKDLKIKEIEGLVYYFDKSTNLQSIKNKLNFAFKSREVIKGLEIMYGYDKDYPNFNYINGKKTNVQIVKNSANIIVGYPMILCGY